MNIKKNEKQNPSKRREKEEKENVLFTQKKNEKKERNG